jgi:hypothetical protein
MKPTCEVARRSDYVVEALPHGQARALIAAFHYSGCAANTSVHSHGIFRRRDMTLVGAALWMPPTANAAKALALRHLGSKNRHREVLVLSRCALRPGEPQNTAGMLLARSERLVRSDARWALLVTYADTAEGHVGTIYKATGWTYDGLTKPETRWKDSAGRLIAKHATKSRTVAQMLALGYVKAGQSRKHRFVKII